MPSGIIKAMADRESTRSATKLWKEWVWSVVCVALSKDFKLTPLGAHFKSPNLSVTHDHIITHYAIIYVTGSEKTRHICQTRIWRNARF